MIGSIVPGPLLRWGATEHSVVRWVPPGRLGVGLGGNRVDGQEADVRNVGSGWIADLRIMPTSSRLEP